MIEGWCDACGQKVRLPDPPARTQEEKIAFRQRWDALVEKARRKKDGEAEAEAEAG